MCARAVDLPGRYREKRRVDFVMSAIGCGLAASASAKSQILYIFVVDLDLFPG